MKFSTLALFFSSQLLLATSLPLSANPATGLVSRNDGPVAGLSMTKRVSAEAAAGKAKEGAKEGAEKGAEEEAKEGEQELEGQFTVPLRLGGANVKQDVLFPPGTNGRLEVEFQNSVGRTLTVTENRSPAAAPPGFVAVEPVSYSINLAEGAQGLTLSKVDYILNPGNALDIKKGQVGRLFKEINAFIIDPALGELEFEAEENELTLTVANMNGEFAIFIPQAAAAAPPAAAEA
ncbi:hypothetical protein CGRA01v4_03929 [Colletotrichum graminicola]|uniref:Accumulation-associated protein n=1 Tax=Colletotrichum graminicola (strain M1.001 / M2 / FGSC 10212) TaxID=645133 RepID=E3QTT8_COLGM|nr:uncharacterized protein GLRG_09394 [Colletotrichum graminicola M1.001]EFQ34250.1 hypothetical protein GLRG_09394 [Colletotrichum graminicola M1.001]WDK12649.1 hypothetical protein CGRA01v4_03929 [Colletotrichum graminicola]